MFIACDKGRVEGREGQSYVYQLFPDPDAPKMKLSGLNMPPILSPLMASIVPGSMSTSMARGVNGLLRLI